MWIAERDFTAGTSASAEGWLSSVTSGSESVVGEDEILLRAIVDGFDNSSAFGQALVLSGVGAGGGAARGDPLRFRHRPFENTEAFNVAVVIPTGVGAEIGGHAGDGGPVVRLLGSICDAVITHPNVVNASDINEAPENALYVEGSVLSRLFLGNAALQIVRKNRVLVVIDDHPDAYFTNGAINAVNGARGAYGLECAGIVTLDPGVRLKVAYSSSGRAVGEISNLDFLVNELKSRRADYDAVALSSVIDVPAGYHQKYFDAGGEMVNPWGGVEAMLTHALSTLLEVPTAHAPMFETRDIANSDPGVVDPRMAAEAVSLTFLQCVLKGLQRSPKIVTNQPLGTAGLLDATRLSCLVIPDGCIGIPTLAALAQGIPVIAVRENRSLMRNNLRTLPWARGQFSLVENYWEAAGVIAAIRAGVEPSAVRRPIELAAIKSVRAHLALQHLQHDSASAVVGGPSSPGADRQL